MKQNLVIFLFVFLAIGVFSACETKNVTETLYKGTVIDSLSRAPFKDLEVCVTNGENIYTSVHTDIAGMFSLPVRVNEVKHGGYYLLVGDSSCIPIRKELLGLGAKPEIDLGIIEVTGPTKPKVETMAVSSNKVGTAKSGGNVTDGGRAFVSARGVCWSSIEQYPTKENCGNQFTTDGTGEGNYESNITGLELGATYYIRAYATNRKGTNYGEPISFKVEEGKAVVATDSIFEIYANRAKCAGRVISDGGFKIVERGVCWSTIPEPTIYDKYEKASADTGKFECQLRGLALSTPYYVRAYVKNEATDITYGEERQFLSADGLPVVTTDSHTAQAMSITIEGTVKDNGGYAVLERGICYSTTNMSPTVNDVKEKSGSGNGSFSVTINDLTPGKTYYVRAYARNENDCGYGDPIPVTTGTGVPTVVLGNITYTATSASTTVEVTDSEGADLQSCGICWSKDPNPSIQGNHVVAGGRKLNTEYICNLSNLGPDSIYYICAYATTNITTNYSATVSFKTKRGEPEVTTVRAEETGRNFLVISGSTYTTNDAPILRQGICWSTTANPSVEDNVVEASVSVNPFSCRIDSLLSGTMYYCRAFAENKYGLGYGKSEPFRTENDETILKGYIYDQDDKPVSGAIVELVGYSRYSTTTDSYGYYSLALGSMYGNYELKINASNYTDKIEHITIIEGQTNQYNFHITLKNKFAVDFGTGLYVNPGTSWEMYFECNQTQLPGQTTTRNMRIKNYRNVSVSWSITNIPTSGITFSKNSGTIPALGEVSITVTFRYPSTNSYMVSLPDCSSGTKTYIWNWDGAYGGYYVSNGSAIQSACKACCWQNPIIMVDNYSEAFTLLFNQGLVWH